MDNEPRVYAEEANISIIIPEWSTSNGFHKIALVSVI